jgi:hypothetical protein
MTNPLENDRAETEAPSEEAGGETGAYAAPGSGREWRTRILVLAGAAIVLRLVLFLGRGDYLAFDEAWYLLLGRSLFTGDGYSLVGIPHVALSPLFPILAGAVGAAIDNWVWGGRIVAAVASGLLVVPAWSIFRRLAPYRTAFVAAALVAVLPSMAPFVVAYWVGADLWVGAEPLLHLFLYGGIALWLRADEGDRVVDWLLSGLAFGLAFLARPEAIITWGVLGLLALGLVVLWRSPRRLAGAVLMGVGFLLLAGPYWAYLRDTTGHWALTGRGISPASTAVRLVTESQRSGGASAIEGMLWQDDEAYERRLYALDDSGLRLGSGYWGVYPPDSATPSPTPATPAPSAPSATPTTPATPATPTAPVTSGTPAPSAPPEQAGTDSGLAAPDTAAARQDPAAESPSGIELYMRALSEVFPLLLWLFVVIGAVRPRGPGVLRREIPVTGALVATSVAVAVMVAVDPRTQLFLVPLLALYAARGFRFTEEVVHEGGGAAELRPGFVELGLAAVAILWLLAIDGQRLYLSLGYGSPHHIVAEQNRDVAEELDTVLDDRSGPVASWHPAMAIYADRDWRVLPFAPLGEIIRYEQAAGAGVLVLSAYYPPDIGLESLGTRYLIVPVPGEGSLEEGWNLRIERGDTIRAFGQLTPRN